MTLTSLAVTVTLQQLVSIWFLIDFFLARDSSIASNYYGYKTDESYSEIRALAEGVSRKHCKHNITQDPHFEKVILIVIDALGSEFIPTLRDRSESNTPYTMPFLENLIKQDKAISFTAKAATPTVTMPRIKALLSGTIPSFADIMFNLAANVSNFYDDNLIKLAKNQGKSVVFYGDDTWLSLFDRSVFLRAKETLSFYATDYTSVDTNVTRSAVPETESPEIDWDFLILHYLGLDHLGHILGTNEHPLINKKLLEMDDVLRIIYRNMLSKNHKTLIILCGDHGMSEEGNHGGSSNLESNTAMVFIPINRNITKIDQTLQEVTYQIDFATSMALLMGMPIPRDSKGVLMERLILSVCYEDRPRIACMALENVIQLMNLTEPRHIIPAKTELPNLLKSLQDENSFSNATSSLINTARDIQNALLATIASRSKPAFLFISILVVSLVTLIKMRRTCIKLLMPVISKSERYLCILVFAFPIFMLGSTDFIELEQIFWPIYSITVFILLSKSSTIGLTNQFSTRSFDPLKLTLFSATAVITTAWSNLKLYRYELVSSSYVLPFISVAILCNNIRQNSDMGSSEKPSILAIGSLIMLTKHVENFPDFNDKDAVYRTSIQRLGILILMIYATANMTRKSSRESWGSSILICKLASSWITIAFLLARRHSFLFLISNVIMEASLNSIVNSLKLSSISRAIIYVNFAQSAFYNQGNTNLFTSVDVKPAFFAQTDYNIYISVPLVAISTYSTHIYWYLKLFQRIQESKAVKHSKVSFSQNIESLSAETSFQEIRDFVLMRNYLSLSYYMLICLLLRNHLFIWSVISPKLIYHFVTNNMFALASMIISIIHTTRNYRHINSEFEKTSQQVI